MNEFSSEAERREALGLGGGKHLEDYVLDDEGGDFPVVCENGCPDGYLGDHKFSCRLAGRWFLRLGSGTEVKVCGAQPGGNLVCVNVIGAVKPEHDALYGGDAHQHVCFAELSRTRYPAVKADLGDLSGPDGDVFAVIGHVAIALAPLGEAVVSEMTEDLFSSKSYDEALAKVRQWVTVAGL